jgi:hypothetical protein
MRIENAVELGLRSQMLAALEHQICLGSTAGGEIEPACELLDEERMKDGSYNAVSATV